MAKYCSNCGAPLRENQRFCTECGSPVQTQVHQQQPQSVQQQDRYRDLQAHQQRQAPQSSVQRSAPKKKKSKAGLVFFIIILLGVVGFFGFRDGGWFRKNSVTYTPAAMGSLRAYAEQLEDAGNTAAAEAVYEQLARGGGAQYIDEAHDDIPIIAATDEASQLEAFADTVKGGGR